MAILVNEQFFRRFGLWHLEVFRDGHLDALGQNLVLFLLKQVPKLLVVEVVVARKDSLAG